MPNDSILMLEAELAAIKSRIHKRHLQNQDDDNRIREINRAIERVRLAQLVGVDDGVMTRYRATSGPVSKLNNARGKLLKVNRTRAQVDFGEGDGLGEWSIPLTNLMPATEAKLQGCIIDFGSPNPLAALCP